MFLLLFSFFSLVFSALNCDNPYITGYNSFGGGSPINIVTFGGPVVYGQILLNSIHLYASGSPGDSPNSGVVVYLIQPGGSPPAWTGFPNNYPTVAGTTTILCSTFIGAILDVGQTIASTSTFDACDTTYKFTTSGGSIGIISFAGAYSGAPSNYLSVQISACVSYLRSLNIALVDQVSQVRKAVPIIRAPDVSFSNCGLYSSIYSCFAVFAPTSAGAQPVSVISATITASANYFISGILISSFEQASGYYLLTCTVAGYTFFEAAPQQSSSPTEYNFRFVLPITAGATLSCETTSVNIVAGSTSGALYVNFEPVATSSSTQDVNIVSVNGASTSTNGVPVNLKSLGSVSPSAISNLYLSTSINGVSSVPTSGTVPVSGVVSATVSGTVAVSSVAGTVSVGGSVSVSNMLTTPVSVNVVNTPNVNFNGSIVVNSTSFSLNPSYSTSYRGGPATAYFYDLASFPPPTSPLLDRFKYRGN